MVGDVGSARDEVNLGPESAIVEAERMLSTLYKALLSTGEAVSARRIHEKCSFLADQKVDRITASAVAKLCTEEWGGPKAQSIANKPKSLAALVKLWDAVHQLKKEPRGRRRKMIHQEQLDPSTAAYVSVLEQEVEELKRKNSRLTQGFRYLQPLQLGFLRGDANETAKLESIPARHVISDVEREAIKHFLSEEHLSRHGYEIDSRGRILDGRQVVVEAPLLSLLKRLAGTS